MPTKANGGAGSDSPKPTKRKFRTEPSPEEVARRQEEKVFQARVKYDRWARSLFAGLWEHNNSPLVSPPDECDEGLFEPDEFSLLPTRDLEEYNMCFDEAIETLQSLSRELEAALDARYAAGK